MDDNTLQAEWETWTGAVLVQKRGIAVMRNVIERLKLGKSVEMSSISQLIDDFAADCKDNEQFANFARIKDSVNYLYSHPINVCIYSMAIGNLLKFTDKQLTNLGIAALLHDIGEVKLPDRMVMKSAKYTESELAAMRRHPKLGYDLLRKNAAIPEDVLMGVLHHHECNDGSGYPSGYLGQFIHPFGKIISVAETFDAMTTNKGTPSSDVLIMLHSRAGKHYESNVINALISLIGMYPMGSLVHLSDGQQAIVIGQNKGALTKPKVVVFASNGQNIEPYPLNLYGDAAGRHITFTENPYTLGIDTNQHVADALGKPAVIEVPEDMSLRDQFYPPNHKSYNISINADPKYFNEKNFVCPICDKATKNMYLENSKLVTASIDDDSRVHHEGINSIYYDIIHCKNCFYTALVEFFPKGSTMMHYFKQKMQPLKLAMMKFPMDKLKYSIDDVFFAYYFALSCVEDCFIEDRILAYAKLWMRISWLYADCRDSEMEKYALGKAHTYFMQAYGFSKPDDKHLQQLMITTGVVCYKVGDKMNGLKLLAAAVTVPDGTDARKEKARELWKKYKDLPK